jgi:hypothetical protein
MTVRWEIILGAVIISASILFIDRYTVSAIGYPSGSNGDATEGVFRLDRWTGELEYCADGGQNPIAVLGQATQTGHWAFSCGFPHAPRSN